MEQVAVEAVSEIPLNDSQPTTPVVVQKPKNSALAQEIKVKGNNAWKENKMDQAIKLYTEAIENDDESAELYRNRSAAYVVVHQYQDAINDADRAIFYEESSKSFCRKAEAFFNQALYENNLESMENAVVAFNLAYKKDASIEIRNVMEQCDYYATWMRTERSMGTNRNRPVVPFSKAN
eukprot:TRINITY_DN15869_c0_g1_i1.p1 TRINITY_DN15869_c0_g1~~TRINITY_DN15869_c0_g1_i1.p1  ORF type:complete len:188 (+),score=43.20 TRINITY_DN15869_c0_g1_i1:30-566(+)